MGPAGPGAGGIWPWGPGAGVSCCCRLRRLPPRPAPPGQIVSPDQSSLRDQPLPALVIHSIQEGVEGSALKVAPPPGLSHPCLPRAPSSARLAEPGVPSDRHRRGRSLPHLIPDPLRPASRLALAGPPAATAACLAPHPAAELGAGSASPLAALSAVAAPGVQGRSSSGLRRMMMASPRTQPDPGCDTGELATWQPAFDVRGGWPRPGTHCLGRACSRRLLCAVEASLELNPCAPMALEGVALSAALHRRRVCKGSGRAAVPLRDVAAGPSTRPLHARERWRW